MTQKSWPWSTVAALGDGATALSEALSREFLAVYFGVQDPTVEGVSKGVLGELAVSGTASPLAVQDGSGICYGLFINDAPTTIAVTTPAVGTTGGRVVLQTNWAGTGGGSLEARTRIASKKSADGSAAIPALTQTVGVTWEISLATFTITTGGVITVTDARNFRKSTMVTTAAEMANRTRSFLVMASNPNGTTPTVSGIPLSDAVSQNGYGQFSVPIDFVSTMTVTPIVIPSATGNIYWTITIGYGAAGQATTTHTATTAANALAVTNAQYNALTATALASAALGDFVIINFERQGGDVLDTVNTTVVLTGFLVTYTADS